MSTILAAVKIWEIIRSRSRIVINPRFSSPHAGGNVIAIHNKSSENLIITFWSVFQKRGIWPFSEEHDLQMQDNYSSNIIIPADSEEELNFSGPDYFSTSFSNKKRGSIFIRLYVSGSKRAKTFCIYKFGR